MAFETTTDVTVPVRCHATIESSALRQACSSAVTPFALHLMMCTKELMTMWSQNDWTSVNCLGAGASI
eukprot:3482363-Rhodomonas_salina.1